MFVNFISNYKSKTDITIFLQHMLFLAKKREQFLQTDVCYAKLVEHLTDKEYGKLRSDLVAFK